VNRGEHRAPGETGAVADQPADTAAGVALIAASAAAYSSAGYFTRLIHVDLWTLICWRGLFSTVFLLAVAYVLHGRDTMTLFRSLDGAGWLGAGLLDRGDVLLPRGAAQHQRRRRRDHLRHRPLL
jgi:hypothetical protein